MKNLHILDSRYKTEWINNPAYAGHYRAFLDIDTFIDKVKGKKAAIEKPGTLTQKGITDQVRAYAGKEIVPQLRREQFRLERTAQGLDARRSRLWIPAIDKADMASAMLRAEVRTYLRSLPEAHRTKLVMNDPTPLALAAVFEVPAFLSGISDEVRAKAQEVQIQKANPKVLAQIDDEREVISLVASAIPIALYELKKAGDFMGNEAAFNSWMQDASAEVEKEISAQSKTSGLGLSPDHVFADLRSLNDTDRLNVITDALSDKESLSAAA